MFVLHQQEKVFPDTDPAHFYLYVFPDGTVYGRVAQRKETYKDGQLCHSCHVEWMFILKEEKDYKTYLTFITSHTCDSDDPVYRMAVPYGMEQLEEKITSLLYSNICDPMFEHFEVDKDETTPIEWKRAFKEKLEKSWEVTREHRYRSWYDFTHGELVPAWEKDWEEK